MMLQALIAYAEREHLGDADFEPVGVRWQIPLTHDGRLAGGPLALSDEPTAKKPPPKTLLRPFTSPNELTQTGDKARSYFLCDTLERGALFLDPKTPEKHENRQAQHRYFRGLLTDAAAAVPAEAPRIQAVLALLADEASLASLHTALTAAKAKPSDNATFAVEGIDLLQSEGLREFWRVRRRRSAGEAAAARELRVCLATGERAPTLDTTEKIKGVPGGLAQGTNLISFDKESFCSFGLTQAQNAPLSAAAELKLRSALNVLIADSRDRRLVFNDVVYLHWTREPESDDLMDLLTSADPDGVAHLLQAVQSGDPPVALDSNAYYCLGLSGNGARVVVRDWLESTVPQVRHAVARWFADLALVDQSDGVTPRSAHKFGALLYALVRADLDELPPPLPAQLLYAILRGPAVPLPQVVLAAALRRQQLDRRKSDDPRDPKLNPARLSLIKAILNRSPNRFVLMTASLDRDSHDPAYLCGRLFAVFDRLQYLALGTLNAGVVERYYASASVTPSLVMGRLFRNAQFHLAKASGGIAENIRKDFEALSSALGSSFPASLDLEAQGRFALGYYHQKADYRRLGVERKDAREAAASEAATA